MKVSKGKKKKSCIQRPRNLVLKTPGLNQKILNQVMRTELRNNISKGRG